MSNANWNFFGQTALVTGAAGGIGAAIVRKLAAASADVVFSDLKEPEGRALESELRARGANVHFFVSDAMNEGHVKALVDAAVSIKGRLDIAINNVGGIARAQGDDGKLRVHDTDLKAWQGAIDLNLTSCFLGMKHQIIAMLPRGCGAIANLTSLGGIRWSDATSPAYSSAKAGVIRLTQYAAAAYAASGIRVNVVAPGFTATEIVLKVFNEEQQKQRAANVPMKRMMMPEELADACIWACSDAASGVTGLTIPVDGGKLIG